MPVTSFPTARIERQCGLVPTYGALPEALLVERLRRLEPLERPGLRNAVCGARTRAEVALAGTLLALRALDDGDERAAIQWLREGADSWVEPMAHVEVGRLYLEGRGVPYDPARAWRYLAAARAIGADISARTDDRGYEERIEARAAGVSAAFDAPALRARFDPRASAASTRRFAESRVRAYREVYVDPPRGTL
jgi:hypothetical protein